MSNEKIIANGKTIDLSKCLKKDARSYYEGRLFFQACNRDYAEFTCVPKGMLIRLTNSPDENKYYTKGYLEGKYKIPKDLYDAYHMDRCKMAQLYQVDSYTYFLKGRLKQAERNIFEVPTVSNKTRRVYDEINFERLVQMETSLASNFVKVKENVQYVITYCNNGQQYISLRKAKVEEIDKLFAIRDLKKLYGRCLKDFQGNELSYIVKAANHKVYISKEFIDRLKLDLTDCRVLYDPEKEIIYLTNNEVYSDLSGDVIDPIKETPIDVMTEETTDTAMIAALLNEFTEFKSSADKIFKEYKELKAENEAIRKALKEQKMTVVINKGKATFEDFEELVL